METYKVEYLTIINSKEDFCKSVSSFNSYLQSYDNLKVSGGRIKFGGVAFSYDVEFGDIVENVQRYFHLKFICEDKKNLESFKSMLRSVRTLLAKASSKPPEVLWDDVSSELSGRAYPIVHELENLMRKLITKFMFIKIGISWTKDAVPREVSDSIKLKKEVASHNYLYEVDFIQLSNFLFKEYSTANSRKLVEKLGVAKKIEELDLIELQELVPRSNWERYFSPIVSCKIEYLQPRWERLYALRCMVAHNNLMSDSDFNEVCLLASEVKEKLAQALDGVDKIQVTREQKSDVAENLAGEINSHFADFINAWNSCVQIIYQLAYTLKIKTVTEVFADEQELVAELIDAMTEEGVFNKTEGGLLLSMAKIRNNIVHNSSFGEDGHSNDDYIVAVNYLRTFLSELLDRHSGK